MLTPTDPQPHAVNPQTSQESYLRLPRRRYFSALERHAVAIGTIAATVLIIGYGFGVEAAQSIIPGFPTMKAPTSAVFMALSLSYLLSLRQSADATIFVIMGALLLWWLSRIISDWQAEANDQAARLSRANEALEQYASSAAHDLKAPARHIMLYSELLSQALAKADMLAARKHAKSIYDSALETPKIIEGMLDFSRSGFTRVSLGNHSLSELVQAAAAQHAADLEGSLGKITVPRGSPIVRFDIDHHRPAEPDRQCDQEPAQGSAAGDPH